MNLKKKDSYGFAALVPQSMQRRKKNQYSNIRQRSQSTRDNFMHPNNFAHGRSKNVLNNTYIHSDIQLENFRTGVSFSKESSSVAK